MKFLYCVLLLIIVSNIMYSKTSDLLFDHASSSYKKKQYGSTVNNGITGLNQTFINLLDDAFLLLSSSSTGSVISNNKDYSFDLQNGVFHFNAYIEYTVNYNSTEIVNTLVYSFEESSYYLTYINNALYFDYPHDDFEVKPLINSALGYYLWNKSRKTAYYVHPFPLAQSKKLQKNIIPGLLLKIQFIDATNSTESIVARTVQKIPWVKLQNLFIEY